MPSYKNFKVVVFSASGKAKYTYQGAFADIRDAINHYEANGGRVIEVKELGVRFARSKK